MKNKQYPIGQSTAKKGATPQDVTSWIDHISALPKQLQSAVSSLSDEQLGTPYRKDGWTIRQVVHHIADSHMNGYIRIKLALTEEGPTIKPYQQDPWSELSDVNLPIEPSLKIIDGLHIRWAELLKSLSEDQLNREVIHPEDGTLTVKTMIDHYHWHGKHHLAHIITLKEQKNWD
jgi:uncharacterized damage-inducible protein DinB